MTSYPLVTTAAAILTEPNYVFLIKTNRASLSCVVPSTALIVHRAIVLSSF